MTNRDLEKESKQACSRDLTNEEVFNTVEYGKVVDVSRTDDERANLEIRREGHNESFFESVLLPSEQDKIDRKWSRLCSHSGVDDPSSVHNILHKKVPIYQLESGDWKIDYPPEKTIESGGYKLSEKFGLVIFIAKSILMLPVTAIAGCLYLGRRFFSWLNSA